MIEKKINILIVERDFKQFEFISHFFKLDNSININRSNGISEIENFRKSNIIDIIIMGLDILEYKGESAFDKVSLHCPKIPIIVLLNSNEEKLASRLLSKGAQDYLGKDKLSYNLLIKSIKSSFIRGKYIKHLHNKLESKNKLFNIISKDMLVPLDGFRNLSDNLYNEYDRLNDDEIKEYLLDLKINSKNIFEIFDNLLVWSKLQSNQLKIELEECDLTMFVKNILNLFANYSMKKDISLILNADGEQNILKTDIKLLNIILKNMIDNAIKYSYKGGNVDVEVEKYSDKYIINIIDRGTGMSEVVKNNLFNVESINSLPGTKNELGHGLGLVICKELLELIDGYFEVKSEQNIGTTFSVHLPRK